MEFEEIHNKKVYEANENALKDKDKKEIKSMIKENKLIKCSACEYVRYAVYLTCPKCGNKEGEVIEDNK